jgi:3-phosphoshikimate 1-carboxyvinyltransferase
VDEIEIIPCQPERPLDATVQVPGSKSITNRALLLAAMAQGRSVIESALFSDDTRYMIEALRTLGFAIEADAATARITVAGRGGKIPASSAELFVGNAGTAMRFLLGFLTLGRGRFRLDGSERMRERPIGELLDTLERLGLHARSELGNRCPPVVIETDLDEEPRFEGGAATIDARASSQFVSALLIPAPLWRRGLRLTVTGAVARPFIGMTLKLMKQWGASSTCTGNQIVVNGGQQYRARNFAVEPDASAAAYFAAAATLAGGIVRIPGLSRDSTQGDINFLNVLEKMGAQVMWREDGVEVRGGGRLVGAGEIDLSSMPDMVATLAAIAPFASTPTRIRNVAFIRHHESDRIRAIATELARLGARVRELDDGIEIEPSVLHPATIETYDDHRIAMSFAVVGLVLKGVRIRNPGCVSKTFPDFFARLKALV